MDVPEIKRYHYPPIPEHIQQYLQKVSDAVVETMKGSGLPYGVVLVVHPACPEGEAPISIFSNIHASGDVINILRSTANSVEASGALQRPPKGTVV